MRTRENVRKSKAKSRPTHGVAFIFQNDTSVQDFWICRACCDDGRWTLPSISLCNRPISSLLVGCRARPSRCDLNPCHRNRLRRRSIRSYWEIAPRRDRSLSPRSVGYPAHVDCRVHHRYQTALRDVFHMGTVSDCLHAAHGVASSYHRDDWPRTIPKYDKKMIN